MASEEFGGDLQACFDKHSEIGMDDDIEGLIKNGYEIVATYRGEGVARYKVLVVAKKLPVRSSS